jgi:hypothetical protein
MKKITYATLLLVTMLMTGIIQAQVGINEDNSQPDATAILDVKSTTKGVLIPRMTTTQRNLISSPATGLLVFDTTTGSFWFYNGSWTDLSLSSSLSDADNDTKIQVEESGDEDKIRFDIEGSERLVIEKGASGATQLNLPNNNNNTFIGSGAGYSNTTGNSNVFSGGQSGYSNTTGNSNVFSGYQAGYYNTEGVLNTFIGNVAGRLSTGDRNTFVGMASGLNNIGDRNSFFGQDAGVNNTTGFGNVFLGYTAGGNSVTDSDKLFIDNTNTSTPLIWGDFSTDILRVNGTLNINNAFSFPTGDGTNGQVLETDGSGMLSWSDNTDTDDQTIDVLNLNGTTLEISLEGDGQATQTLDLSPTYTIGYSAEQGGYIFWVSIDGKHGLVAETIDQSTQSDWYTAQDNISNPSNHSTDGQKFRDWRMPTKHELNEMYLQKSAIGGFAADWYWSSTELANSNAWSQIFSNGFQFTNNKDFFIYVRAVRAF